jgi:hypothetical protein
LGAAGLVLVALIYFAFRSDDAPETPAAVVTPDTVPSPAPARDAAPRAPLAQDPTPNREATRVAETIEDDSYLNARDRLPSQEIPEVQEMPSDVRREFEEAATRPVPAHVQRDFENPYVEPTQQQLAEAKANANPVMPEHIRQQIEEAKTREMPPEVREAFENPYMEPPVDMELLHENGRPNSQ